MLVALSHFCKLVHFYLEGIQSKQRPFGISGGKDAYQRDGFGRNSWNKPSWLWLTSLTHYSCVIKILSRCWLARRETCQVPGLGQIHPPFGRRLKGSSLAEWETVKMQTHGQKRMETHESIFKVICWMLVNYHQFWTARRQKSHIFLKSLHHLIPLSVTKEFL